MFKTLARAVALTPYVAFLLFVLFPIGAVSYAIAAVCRTVWANAKTGWRDHA